jgi:hypothetical protein
MPISIFPPSRSDVRRQDTTFSLQQDNWNDFSFQTLYHLYYRRTENPEDVELIGLVKILRRGQTRADGIQLQAPFEALGDAFCSVGVSLDYYKHLNEIDPAQRTYILDALRDVVAHPELQPQFNAEQGWTVSLFRDTDPAEFLAEGRAVLLDNYTDLAQLTSNLRFDGAGWAEVSRRDRPRLGPRVRRRRRRPDRDGRLRARPPLRDYGFETLGLETIRAYTDPGNAASQKVLLHCGLQNVGEIEVLQPTHHGERRAPLFRISRPELSA